MTSFRCLTVAALLASAAFSNAQVSSYSVNSRAYTGSAVQIVSQYVTQTSILQIPDVPGISSSPASMTLLGPGFYQNSAGVGGSLVRNGQAAGPWVTSQVTNHSGAFISNLAGRFWAWGPTYQFDSMGNIIGTIPGSGGTIQFTVVNGQNFRLEVMGRTQLSAFGLYGLRSPQVTMSGTTYNGEGYFGLGYLAPGTYTLNIRSSELYDTGVVVVSVTAL